MALYTAEGGKKSTGVRKMKGIENLEGILTKKQIGYLSLFLNALFILALVGFVFWGFQYNEQIEKHHCAAVCKAIDPISGTTYYPDCEATGEPLNESFSLNAYKD